MLDRIFRELVDRRNVPHYSDMHFDDRQLTFSYAPTWILGRDSPCYVQQQRGASYRLRSNLAVTRFMQIGRIEYRD